MSLGVSTCDHMCRSDISPTNDWVASKRPPRVSWKTANPTASRDEKSDFLKTEEMLCGRVLYLLLPQDEDPSRFDGVPGGKIQPGPPQHAVLVGLPLSVPSGPGHAHMMPLPIADRQWQRHSLWARQVRLKWQSYWTRIGYRYKTGVENSIILVNYVHIPWSR